MANNQNNEQKELSEILKIRRDKLTALQQAGRDPFQITKYDVTHHSNEIRDNFDALNGKEVSAAGRLMSKRVMGKASFCHIQDLCGLIQAYVSRDGIGEEAYAEFKKTDIGDIIGIARDENDLHPFILPAQGFRQGHPVHSVHFDV